MSYEEIPRTVVLNNSGLRGGPRNRISGEGGDSFSIAIHGGGGTGTALIVASRDTVNMTKCTHVMISPDILTGYDCCHVPLCHANMRWRQVYVWICRYEFAISVIKGVSATLQSGRYDLLLKRRRIVRKQINFANTTQKIARYFLFTRAIQTITNSSWYDPVSKQCVHCLPEFRNSWARISVTHTSFWWLFRKRVASLSLRFPTGSSILL